MKDQAMSAADAPRTKPVGDGRGKRRVDMGHHYPVISLPPAEDGHAPASDSDLGKALKPAIEGVILDTLRENPTVIIDLVYPVLGKAIRRAIGSALAGLAASIEQKATATFKMQGLRWRWEAMRKKVPYAQIVMANSLIYEVEDVLLIHRGTGILLAHVAKDVTEMQDHDLISGMLTAIEAFARDSLSKGEEEPFNGYSLGEVTMVVKSSPLIVVAAAVKGTVTGELHQSLDEVVEEIHENYRQQLEDFDGGTNEFVGVLPVLEKALKAEHSCKIPD